MKKIFQHANDKNVKSRIVYANSTDSKLYEESTFVNQATEEEVTDAFVKGMLVVMLEDVALIPLALDGTSVVVANTGESAETSYLTFSSKETVAS